MEKSEEIHGKTEQIRPMIKVRLTRGQPFFGPGTCQLLELVENTGSLQEACHGMKLSYSKGLRMIRDAEAQLGCRVTERWTGGTSGGGSKLTAEGKEILEKYQQLVWDVQQYTQRAYEKYFEQGAVPPDSQ